MTSENVNYAVPVISYAGNIRYYRSDGMFPSLDTDDMELFKRFPGLDLELVYFFQTPLQNSR